MTLYRLAARLALILALVATATLPRVDQSPDNFEYVLTAAALVVALVMLASLASRLTMPLGLVELAAAVAVVVFCVDGGESLLSHEQRNWSIVRTVCFTLAAAVVALSVMLDQYRRRRGLP